MDSDVDVQKRHLSGWASKSSSSSLLLSLSCDEVLVGALRCSSLLNPVCVVLDVEAASSLVDRSNRFSRSGLPTRL